MYCLTAGADKSEWPRLPFETKSARVALATRVVYKILNIPIDVDVEIIANSKWTNPKAGGFCMNGGLRIVYKESSCNDFEWLVKAVCHESFHALQAQLRKEGWHKELFTELGITEGRIEQCIVNHDKYGYVDIAKDYDNYMRQIYESDARAFENDCYKQGKHLIAML